MNTSASYEYPDVFEIVRSATDSSSTDRRRPAKAFGSTDGRKLNSPEKAKG